jgi:hypothetical protein
MPKIIKYDTISGVFYYEKQMYPYNHGDETIQGNGFIHFDTVITEKLYKRGIYYLDDGYCYFNHSRNPNIRKEAPREVFWIKDSLESTRRPVFTPYKGMSYVKVRLKFEALYIGKIKRAIPLLIVCPECANEPADKRRLNYKLEALPIYVITKVFECN